MGDALYDIIIIIFTAFSVLCFFLSFPVLVLHLRKSKLREFFFSVVFAMVISETFFSIVLIINCFSSFFFQGNIKLQKVITSIFIALIIIQVNYHSIILIHLSKRANQIEDSLIEEDIESGRNSIVKFKNYSSSPIHYSAIIPSVIFTAVFVLMIFNEDSTNSENSKAISDILCLLPLKFKYIFLFIPNIVLICVFFYYLSQLQKALYFNLNSFTKESVIFSFSSAIPIIISFFKEHYQDDEKIKDILFAILLGVYMVLTIKHYCFRVSCYYVQECIRVNGDSFFSNICSMLKIAFCLGRINKLNFTDLSSSYVVQSLSVGSDFESLRTQRFNSLSHEEQRESIIS